MKRIQRPRTPRTPERFFWPNVRKTETCWFWIPAEDRWNYGWVTLYGVGQPAHRHSYEMANGLPAGSLAGSVHICHTCDNPPCVNPAHLFAGDRRINAQDMVRKGRHGGFRRKFQADFELARELRRLRQLGHPAPYGY